MGVKKGSKKKTVKQKSVRTGEGVYTGEGTERPVRRWTSMQEKRNSRLDSGKGKVIFVMAGGVEVEPQVTENWKGREQNSVGVGGMLIFCVAQGRTAATQRGGVGRVS